MRYTEYHAGKAVIKDKNKLSEAMEKLARLEDAEEKDRLGQWIPCSERLPEEPKTNPVLEGKNLELYLVTTEHGSNEQDKVYPFRAFWNGVNFTDGWHILDVIAWMQLPEPYKGE
jgi:hypothetical protein